MIKKSNVLILNSEAAPAAFVATLSGVFKDSETHRVVLLEEDKVRGAAASSLRATTMKVMQKIPGFFRLTAKLKSLVYSNKSDADSVSYTRAAEKEGRNYGKARKIHNAVLRFEPESIVCLTPFDLDLVLKARKHGGFKTNVVAVCSSFTLDPTFFDLGVDAYVVENADVKKDMVALGYPESKVFVCGFPVGMTLPENEELALLRTALGLPMSPSVYLSGGVHGSTDLADVCNMVIDQGEVVNVVVPSILDDNLTKKMRKSADLKKSAGCKFLTAGENAGNYFLSSDLVMTTYDTTLIYKAVKLHKPVVLFGMSTALEKNDAEYLESKGLVFYARTNPESICCLYDYLENKLSVAPNTDVVPESCDEHAKIRELIESFRPATVGEEDK